MKDLPASPFAVAGVAFSEYMLTDADLERFRAATELTSLAAYSATVTDKGLETLSRFPATERISVLVLNADNLTSDALLAHLPRFKSLVNFQVTSTKLSDAAVDAIVKLPAIRGVALASPGITDKGLEKLQALPLEELIYSPQDQHYRRRPQDDSRYEDSSPA